MTQTPSKLTASVVGGGFGGQLSLTALGQSNRFELVAAADLQASVRCDLEIKFPGLQTFETHQDLFAKCPTDVVCVSTFPQCPNGCHGCARVTTARYFGRKTPWKHVCFGSAFTERHPSTSFANGNPAQFT